MKVMSIRLPDDLHDWLKRLAETEHRSMNAQLVVLLERASHRPRQTGPSDAGRSSSLDPGSPPA